MNKKSRMKPNAQDPLLTQLFTPMLRKGDLKKGEIIKAAIKLIATQGIGNLTFESVGKMLGIRRSHVAYHFESPDEIILKCVQYIVANVQQMNIEKIKAAASGKERLRAYLESTFEWAESSFEQASVMILFYYFCTLRREWREFHMAIRTAALNRLSALLTDGDFVGPSEASDYATTIHDLLTGAIVGVMTVPQVDQKKAIAQKKLETIKTILLILKR
ncbi:MAG: hypothetical protein JWQ35_685 [Bacteriovoracaceae bacterium]|nr:hypothetical protein [Bacteriovoracaceae bacterium]